MEIKNPFTAPWNSLELKPPKFEFFETSSHNVFSAKKAVTNEHHANKSRDLLFSEMVLLSKFVASRKIKYRKDKGFNGIQKIVKAVRRIYQLDLKTVTTLMKANVSREFAPSLQLCQWLLFKLQSNGLLLNRTIECCKSSLFMLNHRLRTGHNWIEVILPMSMISRIWSLGTYLLKKCCYSYQTLVVILNDLPPNPKDNTWDFSNYQFPDNLLRWIEHNIPSIGHNVIVTSALLSSDSSLRGGNRVRISKAIKMIKSRKDLKLFILKERNRRRNEKEDCLSKNLNFSQWFNFKKELFKLSKKLSIVRDKKKLLRKIRKKIRTRLLHS